MCRRVELCELLQAVIGQINLLLCQNHFPESTTAVQLCDCRNEFSSGRPLLLYKQKKFLGGGVPGFCNSVPLDLFEDTPIYLADHDVLSNDGTGASPAAPGLSLHQPDHKTDSEYDKAQKSGRQSYVPSDDITESLPRKISRRGEQKGQRIPGPIANNRRSFFQTAYDRELIGPKIEALGGKKIRIRTEVPAE